jgi:phosphopantetheinyl transferase
LSIHATIDHEHDLAWMQDVLLHPKPSGDHPALIEANKLCSGLIVLEHRKLPEDLQEYLTPDETHRADRMGARRRQGFLAVRLGLKLLARFLFPDMQKIPANKLQTLDDESPRPNLPEFAGSEKYTVSASHNKHLTVVAASINSFGIDVEDRAAQAWRGRNFFMSALEQEMARQFSLGPEKAALRVWSCKEATAKAYNIDLNQAVWRVHLKKIGEITSLAKYKSGKNDVYHFAVNECLITILFKNEDVKRHCRITQ